MGCSENSYKSLSRFELKGLSGPVSHLVHKKSGARLVLLKNSDPARSFTVAFRTPPYDNTGLFHIFEHAVLAGSRFYPSKVNFENVLHSSVADFINAMTFPVFTAYPFVTRSEKDFENLLSVYMDAVFFPKAIEDPRIIQREGRRYEIDPKTGKISLNGVVFNEMKGAYGDPYESFFHELLAPSLLPETPYAYSSGGRPEEIAGLKFRQIQEAHKKYYHPQNSLIFLYGDLDFKKTLSLIDKQFLSFFQKDENFKPPEIPRQRGLPDSPSAVIRADYPGPKGPDKDWIALAWLAGPLKLYEDDTLDIMLSAFVSHSTAPLKLSVMKKGLAQSVSYATISDRDNATAFVFKGTDESKIKALQDALNEELDQVIEKGLDKELLTAVFNQYEFQYKETNRNGARKGYRLGWDVVSHWMYWSEDVSLDRYLDIQQRFKKMRELLEDKSFVKAFFKRHFKDNPHRRALLMTPDPGFSEKLNTKLKKQTELALKSKPLGEREKEDQVFRKWVLAKEPEEVTNKTPLLKLADMKADDKAVSFRHYKDKSYGLLVYPLPTEGISYARMFFDLKGIKEEDIKLLHLFSYLLKKTDTENYLFQELSRQIDTFIGDWDFDIETVQSAEDPKKFKTFLKVSLSFLSENREKSFSLLQEVLIHSRFSPNKRAQDLLSELKTKTLTSVVDNARYLVAGSSGKSFFPSQGGFSDLAYGGLFLEHLLKSPWDSNRLVDRFQDLLKDIFNQKRFYLATLTAEEKELKNLTSLVEGFKNALPVGGAKDQIWSFAGQKNYKAYALPVDVQYLSETSSFGEEGLEYSGALLVYANYMDSYFMQPRIRQESGAYGAWSYFGRNGLWTLSSYRDPHLKKSFDIFSQAVDFMSQGIDKNKLKASALGALKPFYRDRSIAGQADFMTSLYLQDLSWSDYIKIKRGILAVTPESFEEINRALAAARKKSQKAVAGSAVKIKKEADFAKEVLSLPN